VVDVGKSGFVLVYQWFCCIVFIVVYGVVVEFADVLAAELWIVDFCNFELTDFVRLPLLLFALFPNSFILYFD
jgi:hypothetical protein